MVTTILNHSHLNDPSTIQHSCHSPLTAPMPPWFCHQNHCGYNSKPYWSKPWLFKSSCMVVHISSWLLDQNHADYNSNNLVIMVRALVIQQYPVVMDCSLHRWPLIFGNSNSTASRCQLQAQLPNLNTCGYESGYKIFLWLWIWL